MTLLMASINKPDLINSFEKAVNKRLEKSIRRPSYYLRYFFYQLSKIRPIFIQARTFFGTRFHCYLPDYFWTWDAGILGDPAEIRLTKFFLKNIRAGDVFLDVGSNCGFYAILGGVLVGEKGRVYAFEPTPKIFSLLKRNARDSKNIFPVEAAISNKSGEAELYLNPLYAVANSLVIKPVAAYKTTKVKVITLDDYCSAQNIKPTFIKLDVEGAEYEAVLGGQKILAEAAPLISIEILDQADGADFSAAEKLVSLGYVPHQLLSNVELEEISLAEIKTLYGSKKNGFYNFIFKKR